jgi:hypothetical protein
MLHPGAESSSLGNVCGEFADHFSLAHKGFTASIEVSS